MKQIHSLVETQPLIHEPRKVVEKYAAGDGDEGKVGGHVTMCEAPTWCLRMIIKLDCCFGHNFTASELLYVMRQQALLSGLCSATTKALAAAPTL
jgi:hypothetical protein